MSSGKNKLPRATLEQKIAALDFYRERRAKDDEVKTSQADIVKHFRDKISISTSSFSEWVKNEASLRELYNRSNGAHRKSKRKLKFKYEEINHEMDLIVQERLKEGELVNEPFLRKHWCRLAQKYGVDNPKRLQSFSHGWLTQFKKRHGIDKQSRERNREVPKLNPSIPPTLGASRIQLQPPEPLQREQPQQDQNRRLQLTQNGEVGGFGLEEYNEEYMNLQNYETLITNQSNFLQQQLNVRVPPQQVSQASPLQQDVIPPILAPRNRLIEQQQQQQQQQQQHQQQQQQIQRLGEPQESTQQRGSQRDSQPQIQQLQMLMQQLQQQQLQLQDALNSQQTSTLSDGDFELFFTKYGGEFLDYNRDKYPESAKLFEHFLIVFKREREIFNERRLRELITKR
ncbi:unnamed protein product [Cyberlindnera jadinii]|uniref:HTH CENPB-type domain-containing protein n=1 Tax=Cyberlindnera jadinii (strain ATCC 18201 / CBS 1600 / BCRC 20928 / JCM 3617 / NBRC 0987 / NRRL Y-1542) TaxID=983966 RepID=A0A0H5C182_CYBJN|nr:unnamed protein product [Cyberlindnera jadinii]